MSETESKIMKTLNGRSVYDEGAARTYTLKDGETIDDAPEDADIVWDPENEGEGAGDGDGVSGEELKEVHERIDALSEAIANQTAGLSSEIKSALMTVVENIGLWKDGNGQTHIDNLRAALYNAPLVSISAVYTQNGTVYATDDIESLRGDLVVTGSYTDGSSSIITDYSLSGSLVAGASTITVTKDGKTTTFEVVVAQARVPATGITIDKTKLSFTGSTSIQLTANVEPSDSTDTVVWSSSEDAVAKVENGLVTPIADGSCTIYATAGDITAECAVSVALPLEGINIGNPHLMYDSTTNPNTSGLAEEELQGKWYKCAYTGWGTALGYENSKMQMMLLHPFTDGTYFVRTLHNTNGGDMNFFAFSNGDIGTNPSTKLGQVGDTYTEATVTKYNVFDCEYTTQYGTVDLGEYDYVDESGTTGSNAFIVLYKITVPKDVYVFMATSDISAKRFPGISETFPQINDLYTVFESDPSANILQIVE